MAEFSDESAPWWRDAVIYQVYPRSFADSDGDGVGDLPGLLSRLDYLVDLGVDAIWISPFYPSPLHDGGYDVADYRNVDPRLGTLDDVRLLVDQCHRHGLRVLLDIVPNHSSSEHPWFREALKASPGSPAWDRYILRPGRGVDGAEPPNNWTSVFHGPAWSQLTDAAGNPTGSWYLHLFDSTQPDFDWTNPEVLDEFDQTLRFWFDLGVDGFRIDVAHGLAKQAGLPDQILVKQGPQDADDGLLTERRSPYWDQDEVHDIYRRWRAIADAYEPPRMFCGEAWVESEERLSTYLRADELHTCFNFEYLKAGWDASRMRQVIDRTIATHQAVNAPPTWVLSNHDVVRHRTRLSPSDPQGGPDQDRGLARARAATTFAMALPGSMYLYQGEELGLPEVTLPDEVRQDPAWHRSGGTDGFRDGCRVPIPWTDQGPHHGFGPGDQSWLAQPEHWAALSVAAQQRDPDSTLNLYRELLRVRRTQSALHSTGMVWLAEFADSPTTLGLRRFAEGSPAVDVIVNLSDQSLRVPPSLGTQVLVASGPEVAVLEESNPDNDNRCRLVLGPDVCVWLRAVDA